MLLNFSVEMQYEDKLTQISLGQGQDQNARNSIEIA